MLIQFPSRGYLARGSAEAFVHSMVVAILYHHLCVVRDFDLYSLYLEQFLRSVICIKDPLRSIHTASSPPPLAGSPNHANPGLARPFHAPIESRA
jgi:hypothetical protein